ncbi:MAG: tetratricopeptide repeat protein [Kofleriaceae bacterium]
MARRFGVVLAVCLFACGDKREPHRDPPPPAQVDPLDALHWDAAPLDWTKPVAQHARDLSGFAGSAACQPCHAAIFASYQRHSMARTGMRPIGSVDQAWIGKIFDAATPVVHERSHFSYTPVRRGTKYFVTETLLAKSGGAVAAWDEPITHVFSAGSYGLAFYSERGGRLIHLPIDYYAKAARWDLDPMAFGGNPRIGVQLDTYCISCHSDEPAQRFRDPLPNGIGCERCHGPSKLHVTSLRAEDTVGPKQHLTARRQLEVCAQCHQSTFPVLRDGRDHFDFRPGEPLDAMRVNFLANPAEQDRVKLLDHAERLVRSACWLGARDKLTCTTCHDPHTSSLEKDATWWDGKCMQCHQRAACTDTKAHRDAAGDHCASCHMRSGPTSNVPLVNVTDHWIQKRPAPIAPGPTQSPRSLVAWSTQIGEPVADAGAAALAHADAGLADEATRLAIAAKPSAPIYDLLASAYLARHHLREAGVAFRAALRLDPDDTGALFGYARVMLDQHQAAEARHAFDRMLQLDPDDIAALETLGIDLYRSGDHAHATELFRRAAATGRASGIAYVGLALDARGDANQERVWLERAWRAEPRDRWILDELAAVSANDRVQLADITRRKTALEPDLATSPATAWIPVQNRRQ